MEVILVDSSLSVRLVVETKFPSLSQASLKNFSLLFKGCCQTNLWNVRAIITYLDRCRLICPDYEWEDLVTGLSLPAKDNENEKASCELIKQKLIKLTKSKLSARKNCVKKWLYRLINQWIKILNKNFLDNYKT